MYFTLLHWQHPLFTRREALRLLIQVQRTVHMTRRRDGNAGSEKRIGIRAEN